MIDAEESEIGPTLGGKVGSKTAIYRGQTSNYSEIGRCLLATAMVAPLPSVVEYIYVVETPTAVELGAPTGPCPAVVAGSVGTVTRGMVELRCSQHHY